MYENPKKTGISRRKMLQYSAAGLVTVLAAPAVFSPKAAFAAAPGQGRKVLTGFHSKTGGTKALAELVQASAGGDILEIIPASPYSDDYTTATRESRYQLVTGKRPANQPISLDVASYDVICIGSPRWWGTLSVPVITFLTEYNLTGKTVVPFSTHGGGSRDKTFDDVEMLCAESKVCEGFAVNGRSAAGSGRAVNSWLRKIDII